MERPLVDLGIESKDVMAFGVQSDRVVIIEGPVGFKRTWWMPGAKADGTGNGGRRGSYLVGVVWSAGVGTRPRA